MLPCAAADQPDCLPGSAPLTAHALATRPAAHLPPPTQVAAFQCLQPMLGTLLAFLYLNEAPTPWDLGALGIVAGLLLVTTDQRREVDTPAVLARLRRLLSQPRSLSSANLRALAWPGGGGGGGDHHNGSLLKP